MGPESYSISMSMPEEFDFDDMGQRSKGENGIMWAISGGGWRSMAATNAYAQILARVLGYLVAKMMMTRAILQWLEAKANPNRGGKLVKKTKPTYKQLWQHLDRLGSFHNFPTVETIMRRLFMVHLTRWEISC